MNRWNRHLLAGTLTLMGLGVLAPGATPHAQGEPSPQPAMGKYTIVLLHTATPANVPDSVRLTAIQQGHQQHIRDMAALGKLVTAGPINGPKGVQGIYIFQAGTTRADVEALVNKDPAIGAGLLRAEYWEWYGPLGLNVKASGG